MWGLVSGVTNYDHWLDEPYQAQFESRACDRCERIFEPDDLTSMGDEVICTKCKEEKQ